MKALSNLTSDTKPIKGPVLRAISRWTEPGPREAVPCLAAGQSDDLFAGAHWLLFSCVKDASCAIWGIRKEGAYPAKSKLRHRQAPMDRRNAHPRGVVRHDGPSSERPPKDEGEAFSTTSLGYSEAERRYTSETRRAPTRRPTRGEAVARGLRKTPGRASYQQLARSSRCNGLARVSERKSQ